MILSGVCRQTNCAFLNSRLSVCVFYSLVGELDCSCESHCDPLLHSVDVDSVVGLIAHEMNSEVLD